MFAKSGGITGQASHFQRMENRESGFNQRYEAFGSIDCESPSLESAADSKCYKTIGRPGCDECSAFACTDCQVRQVVCSFGKAAEKIEWVSDGCWYL